MRVLKNLPAEIDYSEFEWIRRGDLPKVKAEAEKLGVRASVDTIRHVLKKRQFNLDVLVAAQTVVNKKKKRILELQLEGKQLSQAIQMKVA